MMTRVGAVKTILWAIVGLWVAVSVVRFATGLGTTTDLDNATPWGLWIAFDVMSGVALAAGGFVMAATVYIFGLERFRPFVRPAILTAFLGYAAVAVGLLYDLGQPWRIWHPMIYWQHHSVLFEVAMCVMLYLTVLALEFAPVALEHPVFGHPIFRAIHHGLKRVTILLVIAGIVLSTLHQSSLGSLFLIAPHRVHPLWYSPYLYVLFFVSAVGLGLMTVTLESYASAWLFGHRIRRDRIAGLGAAAAVVLGLYAVLRLGDLAMRGQFGLIVTGSWQSTLFLIEMGLSAVAPALLLATPRFRRSAYGPLAAAGMVVCGMVMYRFDVCITAFFRPGNQPYFPLWTEFVVSLGIVAAATLVFFFFVENLRVYEDVEHGTAPSAAAGGPRPAFEATTLDVLMPESVFAPRRYSMAFVVMLALGAALLLPGQARVESLTVRTPVQPPKIVAGLALARPDGLGPAFALPATRKSAIPHGSTPRRLMMIDGNRDHVYALFDHDKHIELEGGDDSCLKCHHAAMPGEQITPCHRCHSDLFLKSDLFDHGVHIARMSERYGEDGACAWCHKPGVSEPKTRATAAPCLSCHDRMFSAGSRVESPVTEGKNWDGFADSYKDAMHDLCISCHAEKARKTGRKAAGRDHGLTRCDACHSS